ncbi:DUF4244 domain-containing protein [Mycolicibacterium austroafricanum]
MREHLRDIRTRLLVLAVADDGMSTVEYAIGTLFICPWCLRSYRNSCF